MYLCHWLSIKYCWNASFFEKIFPPALYPIFSFKNAASVTRHWSLFTTLHYTHIPIYLQESIFQRRIRLKWFTWIFRIPQKQVTMDFIGYSTVRRSDMSSADFILRFFPISSKFSVLKIKPTRCTNRKVAGSIPAGVSGFFIDINLFESHYGSGVDSASDRYEYQEYFVGAKAAGA